MNIVNSDYFKELYRIKTYEEVVDEIYEHVDHVEPWMTGNCRGPSTAFCLLYKLFTLNLDGKQVRGLLDHEDSPYIRAIGFLFLRYLADPKILWDWLEPYLQDEEEFAPGSNGKMTTMGIYIRDLLLGQYYFDSLFPRIPVPVMRQLIAQLEGLNLATQPSGVAASASRLGADGDGARRPPSVKAALSVAFGQRAPHRAATRDSSPVRRGLTAARDPVRNGSDRPRESDRGREADRGRDRERDRSLDLEKGKDGNGDRDGGRSRDRDRDSDRGRDERDRYSDRDRDRQKDRSRERSRSRERGRDRDRDRDRDRNRDRGHDYDRDRGHGYERDGGKDYDRGSRRSRDRDRDQDRDRDRERDREYRSKHSEKGRAGDRDHREDSHDRLKSGGRESREGDRSRRVSEEPRPSRSPAGVANLQKLKELYGDVSGSDKKEGTRSRPLKDSGDDVITLGGSTWR